MEPQQLTEKFFDHFLLQGKLISQIITFWWRYFDDESATEEQKKAADHLGKCFYPDYESEHVDPFLYVPNLLDLFAADPKLYLDNNQPISISSDVDADSAGSNVKTLIAIFGETRIREEQNYLSPIFTSELDDSRGAFYSFVIDNSGTKFGKLTDPEMRISKHGSESGVSVKEYRYHIPIPPRHPIPQETLEEWISNSDTGRLYPLSPHIPFST